MVGVSEIDDALGIEQTRVEPRIVAWIECARMRRAGGDERAFGMEGPFHCSLVDIFERGKRFGFAARNVIDDEVHELNSVRGVTAGKIVDAF